ncbi:MAG: hypothetical protein J5367_04100, partial [Lachnospiraceae bacterium]|nr:hypothetical protein [Lachnospiraceae bacterium]
MKDESPYQFTDTAELLDYGFASFDKLNVAENETRYNIQSAGFFHTDLDILGSSRDILALNRNGSIVIPKGMNFEDAEVTVDYEPGVANAVARLEYRIGDNYVGGTTLDYASSEKLFEFANIITDSSKDQPTSYKPERKTVFVTVSDVVKKLFMIVAGLFFVILLVELVLRFIRSAQRAKMKKRKRYKKRSENRRYNYRKRSENRKHRNPGETLSTRDMYTKPIYKELQKRSADASGQVSEPDYDEDYEDYEDYEDGGYTEEQMVKDFPGMEGYGIELLPLDHPDRWRM